MACVVERRRSLRLFGFGHNYEATTFRAFNCCAGKFISRRQALFAIAACEMNIHGKARTDGPSRISIIVTDEH
jgi:hypothetical protein